MNKEIKDIRIVFTVFAFIFAVIAYKFYPSKLGIIFMIAGGVLLFLIVCMPQALKPAFNVWMKFAHLLGAVNTQIILFLTYIIIFIPAGFCLRLIGKDLMKKKMHRGSTYWEKVKFDGLDDKSRYEKQF